MTFTSDPEVRVTKELSKARWIWPFSSSGRTMFVLLQDFEYRRPNGEVIIVPAGFKTDFTSVPLWTGINYVRRAHASLVHDYLLVTGRDPGEADAIFREALQDLGMGWLERNLYWLAVRANSTTKKLFGMKIT